MKQFFYSINLIFSTSGHSSPHFFFGGGAATKIMKLLIYYNILIYTYFPWPMCCYHIYPNTTHTSLLKCLHKNKMCIIFKDSILVAQRAMRKNIQYTAVDLATSYRLLDNTRSFTFKTFPSLEAGSKKWGCMVNCCQPLQDSPCHIQHSQLHFFNCTIFSVLWGSTVIVLSISVYLACYGFLYAMGCESRYSGAKKHSTW
jgi:hypothetical protein